MEAAPLRCRYLPSAGVSPSDPPAVAACCRSRRSLSIRRCSQDLAHDGPSSRPNTKGPAQAVWRKLGPALGTVIRTGDTFEHDRKGMGERERATLKGPPCLARRVCRQRGSGEF